MGTAIHSEWTCHNNRSFLVTLEHSRIMEGRSLLVFHHFKDSTLQGSFVISAVGVVYTNPVLLSRCDHFWTLMVSYALVAVRRTPIAHSHLNIPWCPLYHQTHHSIGAPQIAPTLLFCSLNHILVGRKVVRSVASACVICRRVAAKPQGQLMGQLPAERVTPDSVFNKVGVDCAGSTRKPTIVKAHVCVFVSLSIRAVHLELVSDLTTDAFIACLRRFISRRGKPTLLWSDHGTNFVGAAREIKALYDFLEHQKTQKVISEFCSQQNMQWQFIPEHTPHFGGLWEAAVKSFKSHLRRIVGNVRLTFEELSTVLTQIEACLNSRPLVALPPDDDGIEALTPGHFLIGRPVEALPDPAFSYRSISILSRWHLCQTLVRHLWQRWSVEYLNSLHRVSKWRNPSRNLHAGDIVVLREDNMTPMKWPIARVIETHAGGDGLVRVVTVKTSTGMYRRPVVKIVLLLTD